MKLHTKINADVATREKNEIEIYDGEILLARIKVYDGAFMGHQVTVFPVLSPSALVLDVKGYGYKLTRKVNI